MVTSYLCVLICPEPPTWSGEVVTRDERASGMAEQVRVLNLIPGTYPVEGQNRPPHMCCGVSVPCTYKINNK